MTPEYVFPNGDEVFSKSKQPLAGKTLITNFKDEEGMLKSLKLEVWFLPGKTSNTRINIQEALKEDVRDMDQVQKDRFNQAKRIYIALRTSNIANMHLEALNNSEVSSSPTASTLPVTAEPVSPPDWRLSSPPSYVNQLLQEYNVNDSDELKTELYRLSSIITDKMTSSDIFENRDDARYMYLLSPCDGGHYLSLVNYDHDFPRRSKHLVIQYLTELSTMDTKMKEVICTGIMSFHDDRIIYIDGESGTYKPEENHLKAAQHVLSTAIHQSFVIPVTKFELDAAFMFLTPLPNVVAIHPDRRVLEGSAFSDQTLVLRLREKYKNFDAYQQDASVRWSCFEGKSIQPMPQVEYSEQLTTMIDKLDIAMEGVDDCCLKWFPEDSDKLTVLLLRKGYTLERPTMPPPGGSTKPKLGEDAEYVSVVVSMDNNQALKMKFKIEEYPEHIGAFQVTLEEPIDCKFGFDITFEESAKAIAVSHGYECLNHGKKVLPRLFAGAVTAVRHKFPQISRIYFSGEAAVNVDQTFDLDEYYLALKTDGEEAATTNLNTQTEKVAWRLMYYKKLGFKVDFTSEDVRKAITNELERIDSEENPRGSDSEKKMGYMSLDAAMSRYEGELVALCEKWTRDYNITCNVTNIE